MNWLINFILFIDVLQRHHCIVILPEWLLLYFAQTLWRTHHVWGSGIAFNPKKTEGNSSSDIHYTEMMHQTGEAFTMLRPAGKVNIDGQIFDAVAEAGFIDKGEPIRVVKYENAQLIVRKA